MTSATGESIQARREALGWSREMLAATAGITIATLYRTEIGKTRPQPLTARAIEEALTKAEAKS